MYLGASGYNLKNTCIVFFCPKIIFTFTNSVNPDEFHLVHHCWQKYLLRGLPEYKELICFVNEIEFYNFSCNFLSFLSSLHNENLYRFIWCTWIVCVLNISIVTTIQGPSWPRILGRSDFSLQEN